MMDCSLRRFQLLQIQIVCCICNRLHEDVRSPTLYNADTDEYLQITGDLLAGDIITVTTKTGNKTVTLDRGGVKTNIINRLVSGSTWLTLREGRNRFYLCGTGLTKLRVKIIHTNAYLGYNDADRSLQDDSGERCPHDHA